MTIITNVDKRLFRPQRKFLKKRHHVHKFLKRIDNYLIVDTF